VARPVKANILARDENDGTAVIGLAAGEGLTVGVVDGDGSGICRRSDSILRIARVASCPFMIGIEISMSMTLIVSTSRSKRTYSQ
jgi:hypothetical protein